MGAACVTGQLGWLVGEIQARQKSFGGQADEANELTFSGNEL